MQQLAIDTDMIACGIGLGAEFGNDFAVHLHATLGDQILGVSTAGDAGLRENLLQPFELAREFWFCSGEDLLLDFRSAYSTGVKVFGHGFRLEIVSLLKSVAGRGVRGLFGCCIIFGAVKFRLVVVGAHIVAHGEISVLPAAFPVRLGRRGLVREGADYSAGSVVSLVSLTAAGVCGSASAVDGESLSGSSGAFSSSSDPPMPSAS